MSFWNAFSEPPAPEPEPTPEASRQELGENLMQMAELVDDMQAMVVARRDKLMADGFSPTAAEAMAEHMWRAMWAQAGQS